MTPAPTSPPSPAPGAAAAARCAWLTTLRADGSPHVTPVWFVLDGGTFWLATSTVTAKCRHLAREPRVALAVDGTGAAPAVAEGTATVHRDVREHSGILARLAEKYDGWDAADERQDGPRVLVEVRVERWLLGSA